MKKMIIAAAIVFGAITAHADPASHRGIASLVLSHPEWDPSLNVRGGEVTLVLPQNLLDAAGRIGIDTSEVLKQELEELGPEMCDNPELSRPHDTLVLHYATQDLYIARSPGGGLQRRYVTVTDPHTGKIVVRSVIIHDYRPRPVECVLPVPVS